jgi:hypothetical protein
MKSVAAAMDKIRGVFQKRAESGSRKKALAQST